MSEPVIINVDDNEPARYARGRILRKVGFDVHDVGTGEAALQAVDALRPDLVLLDVNLPDMNGIDVCRRIKRGGASVIVLQISAAAISAPQATSALNSGADAYLSEPVDPDVLVATIRALLRLRMAEQSLAASNAALKTANAQLAELNAALRRSNDDLEQFAFIASHDLQEPLRIITTQSQLLSRSLTGALDETQKKSMKFVIEAAKRMADLIDDVLAYSKTGRDRPKLAAVELVEAYSWAVTGLSSSIEAAGALVTAEPLPTVLGNTGQLGQVFQNLIGNALKYTAPGVAPVVHVSARQASEGTWTISVRDNGVGIEARYHERIFSPFKRLHGREIPGTGIGLALCRRIVEAHGGEIHVESRPGDGSTFTFSLLSAAGERAATAPAGHETGHSLD